MDEKIITISLDKIDNFCLNMFPVIEDAPDMIQLIASVKENGVTNPIAVFQKEDGRYQLCAGHRRKKACEILNIGMIPCQLKEKMSEDEITIFNHDSNIARRDIPIITQAKIEVAYFDALRRVQKSKKYTDAQNDKTKISRRQAERYKRILMTDKDLHPLINKGRIGIAAAEEVSFIDAKKQKEIARILFVSNLKLSTKKAILLRKKSEQNCLTTFEMETIITGQKRIRIRKDTKLRLSRKVQEEIPLRITPDTFESYIIRAIRFLKEIEGDD